MQTALEKWGISEELYNNNDKMTKSHIDNCTELFKAFKKELEEKNDWQTVSMNEFRQRNKDSLKKTNDILTFAYMIQADPNIIARPEKPLPPESDGIAQTIPIQYKYVSAKEKEELGMSAYAFRKIYGKIQKWLSNRIKDEIKVPLVDLLSVLNYLVGQEAMGYWVYLEIVKIAGKLGMSLESVLETLNEMRRLKLIIITPVPSGKKSLAIVQVIRDESDYERALQECKDPSRIIVHIPAKQQRKVTPKDPKEVAAKLGEMYEKRQEERDKGKVVSIKEIPADEISARLDGTREKFRTLIAYHKPSRESSLNKYNEEIGQENYLPLDFSDEYDKIVGDSKSKFAALLSAHAEQMAETFKKKEEQYQETILRLSKEKEDFRARLTDMESRYMQMKADYEPKANFAKGFSENAYKQLTLLCGVFLSEIETMSKMDRFLLKDPKVKAELKGRLFNTVAEYTKKINDYPNISE